MDDQETQANVELVQEFFAAFGRGDTPGVLALSAEDIEWVTPGADWPLAGTRRGHAGLTELLQTASDTLETSFPAPPEFIAQGDRVLVIGYSTGKVKATNRPFEDHFVIALTVRKGQVTHVREYLDTLAMARAAELPASPTPVPSEPETTRTDS